MNSSDRTTLKLLDELEGEMDSLDGKQYAETKTKVETKEMVPAQGPDKLGNQLDKPKSGDNKNTYLNPDRQNMLDESERNEAKAMPVRGQFGRSRKGNA